MPIRQPVKTIDQLEQEESDRPATPQQVAPGKQRGYVIHRYPQGLYYVGYEGGGEVPDALKGSWTTKTRAEQAIAKYIAEQQESLKAA